MISQQDGSARPLGHKAILAISLPIIFSNVSTPLIGVVDTAILGQLEAAHYIGAVALGATVFTMLFWGFGFLRMGTSGLTAQAFGQAEESANFTEVRACLYRALLIAALCGGALIILQWPIAEITFFLLEGSRAVESEAQNYFYIRIWSAPFALANYAILGWFIGQGRAGTAFILQLVLNGANLGFDVLFVTGFGWDVAGVAWGTVLAEFCALLLGLVLVWRKISLLRAGKGVITWTIILAKDRLKEVLQVNGDIMIRTLCLIAAFTYFTAQSAKGGDIILAGNAILMHFLMVSAYFLDGFAVAAEVLVGQAIGAQRRGHLHQAMILSSLWGFVFSIVLSAVYYVSGHSIIDLLTIHSEIREQAKIYLLWAVAAPLAGIAAFQLDGIFIGATRTQVMRNMMIVSLTLYLVAALTLPTYWGNHGLWAAIIVFFIARALTLALNLKVVFDTIAPQKSDGDRRELSV